MEWARILAYITGMVGLELLLWNEDGQTELAVIRKFLLEAADGKTAKGRSLLDVLYIPEMFNSERPITWGQRCVTFRLCVRKRTSKCRDGRQPLAQATRLSRPPLARRRYHVQPHSAANHQYESRVCRTRSERLPYVSAN
jgi:hypothetical protein